MNWLAQYTVQVGLPTKDQSETVEGIIAVIHEPPYVVKDSSIEELCFINSK